MTRPVAITLFCEDVRPEVSGATTLVGAITDELMVPGFPAVLPKLCAYSRVIIPIEIDVESLTTVLMIGGVAGPRIDFEADLLKSAQEDARSKGAPSIGFIGTITAAPFFVEKAADVLAITTINGEELLTGYLRLASGKPTS